MYGGEKITAYIAAICAAKDVRYAVICPGSRSAPLTLAFARQEGVTCLPVVDERSAGYIALGIAQQTELPVALICTSGTAALNFSPAVAEAFYQKVPLLVFTADRPAEWIGQQDGQAVMQQDLYRSHVCRSYHFSGEAYHEDDLWYAQRCVNEAIDTSIEQQGPVHLNVAFREPLYDIPPADTAHLRVIRSTVSDIYPVNSEPVMAAAKLAAGYKKICIVLGQMRWDDELEHLMEKMEEFPNVVVVKESLCNLNVPGAVSNAGECVCCVEEAHAPDLIISMGGPVVSKRFKQWLRSIKAEHWHIAQDDTYIDTFKNLTRQVKCNFYTFIFSLSVALKKSGVASPYRDAWKQLSAQVRKKTDGYSASAPFSDWAAFDWIYRRLPDQAQLQLGNSTAVRYGQIFAHHQPHLLTYANRGTSGIDGSLSTAVGAAMTTDQPVVAILGDLAFQYDANALWNEHVPPRLKVIVINNSGGNIFRLIDGSSGVAELEKYFETRMSHSFEHLSRHFGAKYFRADSAEALEQHWDSFLRKRDRVSILEIVTDPVTSQQVFKEFYGSLMTGQSK